MPKEQIPRSYGLNMSRLAPLDSRQESNDLRFDRCKSLILRCWIWHFVKIVLFRSILAVAIRKMGPLYNVKLVSSWPGQGCKNGFRKMGHFVPIFCSASEPAMKAGCERPHIFRRAQGRPVERRSLLQCIGRSRIHFHGHTESCADSKTSHMFFAGAGREANLKQSDRCSSTAIVSKYFLTESSFGPVRGIAYRRLRRKRRSAPVKLRRWGGRSGGRRRIQMSVNTWGRPHRDDPTETHMCSVCSRERQRSQANARPNASLPPPMTLPPCPITTFAKGNERTFWIERRNASLSRIRNHLMSDGIASFR